MPAILFAMFAQAKVRGAFDKYSRYRSQSGQSGAQIARQLLDAAGLQGVQIRQISGNLGDHYDPRNKTLALSQDVYNSPSLAALGVAAHEVGHAIQDHTGYGLLHLRNNLVPVAQFGSNLAFPLFFAGLLFRSGWIMDVGILLFFGAVVFTIITLPVEYNASGRAVGLLEAHGFISGQEIPAVRSVLDAAALTYVAATAMAVAQFLRLLSLRNRQR